MKSKLVGILFASMVLMFYLNAVPQAYGKGVNPSRVEEDFGAYEVLVMLNDFLSLVVNRQYDKANATLEELSQAYIPQGLRSMHKGVINNLRLLVYGLNNLSIIEIKIYNKTYNTCINGTYKEIIRMYLVNIYRSEYRLINDGLLSKYTNIVSSYINDTAKKFFIKQDIKTNTEALVRFIDRQRDEVIKISNYGCGSSGSIKVIFNQLSKSNVLGGSIIEVKGKAEYLNNTPAAEADVSVML